MGLIRRRADYVKRGKISKNAADRLRRLEVKADLLRAILRTREYQVYYPRTKATFKTLNKLTPEDLRNKHLPFVLIRTGQRIEDGVPVPNKIKRVSISRGKIKIRTEGRASVYLPITPRQYIRDPAAAIRQVEKEARAFERPLVSIHTGRGTLRRLYKPGPLLAAALANLYTAYTASDPENDPAHAFEDWFEGFTVLELKTEGKNEHRGKTGRNQKGTRKSSGRH